jgi:hypothetical protein
MKHQLMKLSALALIITIIWSSSAGAVLQGLDLQTQLQYRTLDIKSGDTSVSSTGGFSTAYNLALRQPLTPLARLLCNLSVNSISGTDELGKQQNRNMIFNLSSYERTYTLTMGYVRNQFSSLRTLNEGQPVVSSGEDKSYDLNFFMEEPAYPSINLQLRRRSSSVGTGLEATAFKSNSWLAGAFYDFSAFRFSFDQSKQSLSFSGSQPSSVVSHRRAAVTFDQTLLNGLSVAGELSKDRSNLAQTGRPDNNFSGTVKSIRLTATPTPAVVINADKYVRNSTQDFGNLTTTGRTSGSSLSLRGDMMPGLSLSVIKAHNNQTDTNRDVDSDNTTGSLNALLAPDVRLSLSWSKIKQLSMPQLASSNSTTTLATLQMPAGMGLDFSLDGGTSSSVSNVGPSFDSQFAGATLRGNLSADASAGLSYRWNHYQTGGVSSTRQTTNSVDFDLSWLATSTIGLNARVNYYLNQGSNISEYVSPYLDLRWTPNNTSSVTMHYNFSKSRQWDWVQRKFIDQGDKGLSLRLTHGLSADSSLDMIYDFQSSDIGTLTWQRSLRILFNHRL